MRKIKTLHKISILLFFAATVLIVTGAYLSYITNPKRIIQTAIATISSSTYQDINPKKAFIDTNTINSNIKLTATSEYLENLSLKDENYKKYVNLLNNISNISTQITISQDNITQEHLLSLNSSLNNEILINQKQYIKQATEYFYSAGLRNTYINNGNNNYFVTNGTKEENILSSSFISTLLTSLKDDFQNENFITSQEIISINNNTQSYNKVSLILKKEDLLNLKKNIEKQLTNNKELNSLITTISRANPNIKIDTKTISKDTIVILNVYTNRFKSQILKYELIMQVSSDTYKIDYEYESKKGTISKNSNIIYTYTINKKSNNIKISIYSSKNKNIGSIVLDRMENCEEIIIDFNDSKLSILGNYQYEMKNITNGYLLEKILNLRITNNNMELININYIDNSTILPTANIKEDISNSVLRSSITTSEEKKYNQELKERFDKLYQ